MRAHARTHVERIEPWANFWKPIKISHAFVGVAITMPIQLYINKHVVCMCACLFFVCVLILIIMFKIVWEIFFDESDVQNISIFIV